MKSKFTQKAMSGILTSAMTFSLITGATWSPVVVDAATTTFSGYAVKADATFDGSWNGNYEKNYNQEADDRNSVCFRAQQKATVTLEKRMYIEADVAIPESLIAKITKEDTRLSLDAWLDFATNTPTQGNEYWDNSNISGGDNFQSSTTISSKEKCSLWEKTDGKEKNTDSTLTKSGSYYIAHVKSAIEAKPELTKLKATEVTYNIKVNGANIIYDGFVLFDNLKLTDSAGKEIAGTGFDRTKSDVFSIGSYQANQDIPTSYVDFQSGVVSYGNTALAADIALDSKYISNEKDQESYRNTKATEHSMDTTKLFTSGVKMKAGTYDASATLYIPKAALDKAKIQNKITIAMNVNAATKIKTDNGWSDLDWDSIANTRTLGATEIVKGAAGRLEYYHIAGDKDGQNMKASDLAAIPTFGDYYVVKVQSPVYLEKTNTYKGMNVSVNICGDGVDYNGIVLADDFKVCSSSAEIYHMDFDNGVERHVGSGKVDITKPHKDTEGLIEWYDFMDNTSFFYGINNSSADASLNKSAVSVYTGKSVKFTTAVTGASTDVSYRIGNEKIATVKVSNKGTATVTGVQKGYTYLYATSNGVTTKAKVIVKASALAVKKTAVTVKAGKTVTLKATTTPSGKIAYTTKNKKIATVTAKGVVKGVKKGTTTITVKANGIVKTVKVTVK